MGGNLMLNESDMLVAESRNETVPWRSSQNLMLEHTKGQTRITLPAVERYIAAA